RLDGGVAAGRFFLQGGGAEDVEVAPRARRASAGEPAGRDGWRLEGGPVAELRTERKPPRQDLVEDDAQRVHVGVHADELAADLLGRRVAGRHRAEPRDGGKRVEPVEVLGDAEVEESRRTVRGN